MTAAIDNDLLYKGAWYGLLQDLLAAVPTTTTDACVLGQAKFVIGKRLEKQQTKLGSAAADALAHLRDVLAELSVVEPTEEEQQLAAELEHLAQLRGLALDGGESILCSVMIKRGFDHLATGDKRAIAALGQLASERVDLQSLEGKIVCLEQLVIRLLNKGKVSELRRMICTQAHADKALAMCFSCSNPEERPQDWIAGLQSYITSVRATAPTLLTSE